MILTQIMMGILFLRVKPSSASRPYTNSVSGYPSLSVYPSRHSVVEAIELAVPAMAPTDKSWLDILSGTLDDFIRYFLPDDKSEYEQPKITQNYELLPTEQSKASFNLEGLLFTISRLMTHQCNVDHISIMSNSNSLN